jgi:hypothetical protein
MSINFISPSTYTTALLIGDTKTVNGLPNILPTLTQNDGAPASAAFEVQSTLGAILMSRMDQAAEDALNAVNGMMIYNEDLEMPRFFVSGIWQSAAIGPFVMTFQWNNISVSQDMASDNGYFCDTTAADIYLMLPATCPVGSVFRAVNLGANNFHITQNDTQFIQYGNEITTVGTGGSIVSTMIGDSIEIICYEADTGFVVLSSMGNLTFI